MQMVIDKETKMRETLKIMSMKTGAYGLSFFIGQSIFILIIAIIMTVTFYVINFTSGGYGILMMFVMLLQGMCMLLMSMALTTIFSDSKMSI